MSAQEKATKKAFEEFSEFIGKSVKGEAINGMPKAINAIGNNGFGVAEAINRMVNKESFGQAMSHTFGKAGSSGRSFENGYDVVKIAGSYIGASAAGRVISGGGLTRDSKGNPNIIGIPFV